jgi:hypothetical protein
MRVSHRFHRNQIANGDLAVVKNNLGYLINAHSIIRRCVPRVYWNGEEKDPYIKEVQKVF